MRKWMLIFLIPFLFSPAPSEPQEPQDEEAPENFIPSERLPADSGISFPTDI